MDYFWARDKVRKILMGLLIHTNDFCFLNGTLFLLYLQFTFFYGQTDKGNFIFKKNNFLMSNQCEICMEVLHYIQNVTKLAVKLFSFQPRKNEPSISQLLVEYPSFIVYLGEVLL